MKEVVYGLGGVSTDTDGSKCHSVSGEREQQRVACDWEMNELHVAKAEGYKLQKCPAETIESKNSQEGWGTEEQQDQTSIMGWALTISPGRQKKK